jgi:methylmalonyl-CoA mutase
MAPADTNLALNEFPRATREEWRKLVDRVLKGAPFERLVSTTYDGLRIEPLYEPRRNAVPILSRTAALPWQIMQRVEHPDPSAANAQLLDDLENGASGLSLVCAGAAGGHGFGLAAGESALEQVLKGVNLDAGVSIEFDLSPQAKDIPLVFADIVCRLGLDPKALDIRFGFDPLGAVALAGGFPVPWTDFARLAAALASDLAARGFQRGIVVSDGRIVHAAGGSEAQELAYGLAVAVAYLRALEDGGIDLDRARRMLFFRLAADADQFLTIAKFRALRKLWTRIEQACGVEPEPAFISAETAWRMMTRRDPWVNLLRATIATFAAGVGGADAITVLPFTAALGLPDAFARRLARNTQPILLQETNLAKVLDPAAGSGGLEALTDDLCRAAWALFQEIEMAGGAAVALERGLIQDKVAATREQRERAVACRKDAITGTSEFPHLQELSVSVEDAAPAPEHPAMPILLKTLPLRPMRLTVPFEELRDSSDRTLASTGARPRIFLATLGKLSDFAPRATLARNFFEVGGIETVFVESLGQPEEMIAAFKNAGTAMACLCSSDEVYAAQAATAAKMLKEAGAKHIYIAGGRPGDQQHALRDAGVQTFIYSGCDALATLQASHDMLKATA